MRFLQVIWAMRDGQVLPLRALLAAALVCCLWATATVAAPQGGVPSATWQDNDRNHRRSPNQIVTQLRTPQAQAGQMPLADGAQDQRAAKARNQLAAGEAPVVQDGQLNMLGPDDWRLKILSAAVTNSDMVLLGDIAVPLGQMGQDTWAQLRVQQLWPAPPEEGKPLQISHSRLSQALRQALGKDVAGRCILPSSLVIQRGGLVFHEEDLRSYVVKSLTPQLSAMPGQVELSDFGCRITFFWPMRSSGCSLNRANCRLVACPCALLCRKWTAMCFGVFPARSISRSG